MQDIQTPKINYRDIPDPFPPVWAIAYGQDNKGFWAELAINNVIQGMRWIPSGWFLMGSPAQEHSRSEDEKQFEVTLPQGCWLAETACTQEFWQAVMGDNPAHFKEDKQNPVEQVSWEGVQRFLKNLNALIPSLNACLPTEAQWEYPEEAMIDPKGAKKGESRVVRGGSWIGRGQGVRSADRRRLTPDDRDDDGGFRLSLGQATDEAVAENKE